MDLRKITDKRLSVIVPLIVGVITIVFLVWTQAPEYGDEGIIRYNNALDPHMFIIYVILMMTASLALVDFVYWLIRWCRKQNVCKNYIPG